MVPTKKTFVFGFGVQNLHMMRFGFLFAANYGNRMTQLNLTLFEIRVQLLTGGGARGFSISLRIEL